MTAPISRARPAPGDDRQLAALQEVARKARAGTATRPEAEFLLGAAAPLLAELASYRAAGGASRRAGNVVSLPRPGRA